MPLQRDKGQAGGMHVLPNPERENGNCLSALHGKDHILQGGILGDRRRGETQSPADLEELLIHIGPAGVGQAGKGLRGQLGVVDHGVVQAGVLPRADQAVEVGPQLAAGVAVHPLQVGEHREAHIISRRVDARLDAGGVPPDELHADLGIRLPIGGDQPGQKVAGGGIEVADAQLPTSRGLQLAQAAQGPLLLVQDALGVLQEELPGPGERHVPRGAQKQACAHLPLQGGDLMGHGGLRHIEFPRRLGKVPVTGHRHEIAKLLGVHCAPSSPCSYYKLITLFYQSWKKREFHFFRPE